MASEILSKYVMPGYKVDIRTRKTIDTEGRSKTKIYPSQVYDIISEERVEIFLPMEKTKLVMLPIGGEYDLFFYSENSIYQCKARVAAREKRNSNYLLIMDIISSLRKDQRREYYRFSCAVEMKYRVLEAEEIAAWENTETTDTTEAAVIPESAYKKGMIVDISGGGLRFVTDCKYEVGDIVLCKYYLYPVAETGMREYELMGKVLSIKENPSRLDLYEHRIQYIQIEENVREDIIKYIFEEERKNLKKKGKD